MTAYLVAEVWCDADECDSRLTTDGEPSIRELRSEARDKGWRFVQTPEGPRHDICPDCYEEPEPDGVDRSIRYPFSGLLAFIGSDTTTTAIARRCGVHRRSVNRWKVKGLTSSAADRAATAYDSHPELIWPGFTNDRTSST